MKGVEMIYDWLKKKSKKTDSVKQRYIQVHDFIYIF